MKKLRAYKSALEWVGERTLEHAWEECEHPDWMFRIARKAGVPRTSIVRCACLFARQALPYARAPDALSAIEAAEKWCSDPTEENSLSARVAAGAVRHTKTVPVGERARHATDAAKYAAYATWDAVTCSAIASAHAARAIAVTEISKVLAEFCDVIRREIPAELVSAYLALPN